VGTVIMHNAVSVDGFIADQNDDVGPLHEWYFNGDTPITGDGEYDHSGVGSRFKVSRASGAASRSHAHRRTTSGRCGRPSARS
jgi:hypothetical protein